MAVELPGGITDPTYANASGVNMPVNLITSVNALGVVSVVYQRTPDVANANGVATWVLTTTGSNQAGTSRFGNYGTFSAYTPASVTLTDTTIENAERNQTRTRTVDAITGGTFRVDTYTATITTPATGTGTNPTVLAGTQAQGNVAIGGTEQRTVTLTAGTETAVTPTVANGGIENNPDNPVTVGNTTYVAVVAPVITIGSVFTGTSGIRQTWSVDRDRVSITSQTFRYSTSELTVTSGGGTSVTVTTGGGDNFEATINGLAAETTYYWRISVTTSAGTDTETSSTDTTRVLTPPGVTVAQEQASSSELLIRFDIALNGLNLTALNYGIGTTAALAAANSNAISTSFRNFRATGLTEDTTYHYIIRATNSDGVGSVTGSEATTEIVECFTYTFNYSTGSNFGVGSWTDCDGNVQNNINIMFDGQSICARDGSPMAVFGGTWSKGDSCS